MRRFRPNIVLAAGSGSGEDGNGDLAAWEEDFWKVLGLEFEGEELEVELTANCVRCRSLDVDFRGGWERGARRVLKRLIADRRVDQGARWNPVFGRYGGVRGEGGEVKVGAAVRVVERNEERTVLKWPGIGTAIGKEEDKEQRARKEDRGTETSEDKLEQWCS